MKSSMTKFGLNILVMLSVFVLASTACSNKDSEKRIAELENRLKELEGTGAAATPSATPSTAATPAEPEVKPDGPLPSFEFVEMEHDFGTIKEGDVVEHTFKFKNTGEAPLIIQSARGSCGCTVPTWPKEPIPVGGTGEITAKFDSKGKAGNQNKTVTISANTWPKSTTLRIKTQVTKLEETSGPVK
ncbi:MAG: DUF1573 domain-containing protein [Cyclobacteriaceae bacterium]|nr:DUF1573 domain-containing protein [Cyclobacteriaceae bacterium]